MSHEPGYIRWRSRIPFSDEQIAAELDRLARECPKEYLANRYRFMADRARRDGVISKATLGMAMPGLVKFCGICGKTALYRYGNEGRCREHKHNVPVVIRTNWKRRDDHINANVVAHQEWSREQHERDRFKTHFARTRRPKA